jgi:pimeloyl-ACP methyl ester carboxylesterase
MQIMKTHVMLALLIVMMNLERAGASVSQVYSSSPITVGNGGWVSVLYDSDTPDCFTKPNGTTDCETNWPSFTVQGDCGLLPCTTTAGAGLGCDGFRNETGFVVGFCYTTPGTKHITINVYSCAPPWIPGAGDLLDSWSTTVTVLPRQQGDPPPTSCSPSLDLIDPVQTHFVANGGVVNAPEQLALVHETVGGVVADGVTQVVVRIPANKVGDSFTIDVLNENNQIDPDGVVSDGGLLQLGDLPGNATSSLTVKAVATGPAPTPSPMAFAVYLAPANFYRGAQDGDVLRHVTLQLSGTDVIGQPFTLPTTTLILRPPVVLIHGLWSDPVQTWGSFSPQDNQKKTLWGEMDPRAQAVDYSADVDVSDTVPSYLPRLSKVTRAALGFAYNAPEVLRQVRGFIHTYGTYWNVAAVQADVVGHSMGGDVARTMAGLENFQSQADYSVGPVHKLITIGTPHNGTPLASALLPNQSGDPNNCVRRVLALAGKVSLLGASTGGGSVSGAVGDLRSPSLPTGLFPVGYIAATTSSVNLAGLNATFPSWSASVFDICGLIFGNPLALDLTPAGWNAVFSGEPNDAIVPVSSQLNGTSSTLIVPSTIHSGGIENLDFLGPTELETSSGIPDMIVNLLNEATSCSDFH